MNEKEIDELVKWDGDHIIHSRFPIGQNAGFIIDGADGVVFRDIRGKEYIDGSSQLVCVNLGYSQREIIEAALQQMLRLPYSPTAYGHSHQPVIECAKRLAELTPEGLNCFQFTSGGSDSTETAYRLARLYWSNKGTQKYKIISLYDSYHGINLGSLSADGMGKGLLSRGLGPPAPGFVHIPSYNCYHCMLGLDYPDCGIGCARFLEETIIREGPDTVAAFIVEPVQGSVGMISPPPEYWPMVREICTKHNVLLIADEVMTGFGRTGKMFAVEHWEVIPDMMTLAKGITGAYLPFGAVAMNEHRIYEELKGCITGSYTYSGHPTCAAAAIKTMEIYTRDEVVENAAKVGKHVLERLDAEFRPLSCVGNISGLGLMLGIEIVADKEARKPFPPEMNVLPRVQKQALDAGLFISITNTRLTFGDRLNFCPPLVITAQQVDRMLDILYPIVSGIEPA
jgi:putrescine aminotransferase